MFNANPLLIEPNLCNVCVLLGRGAERLLLSGMHMRQCPMSVICEFRYENSKRNEDGGFQCQLNY